MSPSRKKQRTSKLEDDRSLGELLKAAVSLRRELHAHPEPGFEEKETQKRLLSPRLIDVFVKLRVFNTYVKFIKLLLLSY